MHQSAKYRCGKSDVPNLVATVAPTKSADHLGLADDAHYGLVHIAFSNLFDGM